MAGNLHFKGLKGQFPMKNMSETSVQSRRTRHVGYLIAPTRWERIIAQFSPVSNNETNFFIIKKKMHPDDVVIMRRATGVAANFLSSFIYSSRVENEVKRRDFVVCLEQLLASRFEHHWHPEHPSRGQAYRCIRLNPSSGREALIETAVIVAGLTYADIQLPLELTVWIDPDRVAYRIGENDGSHCTLVSLLEDQVEALNNTTTTLQTPIKGEREYCPANQIVFQLGPSFQPAPCPALSRTTCIIDQCIDARPD